jgi:hypothetical protein
VTGHKSMQSNFVLDCPLAETPDYGNFCARLLFNVFFCSKLVKLFGHKGDFKALFRIQKKKM